MLSRAVALTRHRFPPSISSSISGFLSSTRSFSSFPDHTVVGMPSLSPTMTSGVVSQWNFAPGDSFIAGDSLAEVQTDKASIDFESTDDGVMGLQFVEEGVEVQCGEPICITLEEGEEFNAGDFEGYVADASKATPAPNASPLPDPPAPPAAPTPATPQEQSQQSQAQAQHQQRQQVSSSGERVIASPLAKTIARENEVNLGLIHGLGPGGRILAEDVREFIAQDPTAVGSVHNVQGHSPPPSPTSVVGPPTIGENSTDFPTSFDDRQVAANLLDSKRNVPHYYLTVDVSVDALISMRETLNANASDGEAGVSVNDLIIKAAGKAMEAVPSVNSSWLESVVRQYDNVDINVVSSNGHSPCIRDVNNIGVSEISRMASSKADFGTGTFSIVNLGSYGIKSAACIIRRPQSAILSLGAIEERIVPSEQEGVLYKKSDMLTATLSCDHRTIDGAIGAQWLQAFKHVVEKPVTLLL